MSFCPTAPRPYPTFQPKMPPPARHLYVADVRASTPDERILLLSLQGLVNRTQPRIYLILKDDGPLLAGRDAAAGRYRTRRFRFLIR